MKVLIEVDKGMVSYAYADGDVEITLVDHDAKEIDQISPNTDRGEMERVLAEVDGYEKRYEEVKV